MLPETANATDAPSRRLVAPTSVTVDLDVEIPMRDGVILRADVYRPAGRGQYPVLLGRTCYGKRSWGEWIDPLTTASEGFAVVINDTRGGFASEGEFAPYFDDAEDGYDTVEWCGVQEWSNGRVGMFGSSAPGFVQLLAAAQRPPHLVAIAPMQTWSNFGHGCIYDPGGAFSLHTRQWVLQQATRDPQNRLKPDEPGFAARHEAALMASHHPRAWNRHRPLSDFPPLSEDVAGYLYEWMRHPDDDDYWAPVDMRQRYGDVLVPALHLVGWFDRFNRGTVQNFIGLRDHGGTAAAREGQWLIIGPWPHGLPVGYAMGSTYFGTQAQLDVRRLVLDWYDHWLRDADNYIPKLPRVHLFMQGVDRWTTAGDWPPTATRHDTLYLHSSGDAAESGGVLAAAPPANEAPDTYVHDPLDPVPSTPGREERPTGPSDQTTVEARPDVLVYTSAELDEDVWVCGGASVELWAATSATDTDWVARLVDVAPDGVPTSVCEGALRARYRASLRAPEPVTPDTIYRYEISLLPTSRVFRAGHRIRVELCSSSIPAIDVNTGTGELFSEAIHAVSAHQHVYHDAEHPSRLMLPVAPAPEPEPDGDALPRWVG